MTLLRRFIAEDSAQDLVEYALLCAFVAVVGVLVWQSIVDLLGLRYTDFNDGTQAIWQPQDP